MARAISLNAKKSMNKWEWDYETKQPLHGILLSPYVCTWHVPDERALQGLECLYENVNYFVKVLTFVAPFSCALVKHEEQNVRTFSCNTDSMLAADMKWRAYEKCHSRAKQIRAVLGGTRECRFKENEEGSSVVISGDFRCRQEGLWEEAMNRIEGVFCCCDPLLKRALWLHNPAKVTDSCTGHDHGVGEEKYEEESQENGQQNSSTPREERGSCCTWTRCRLKAVCQDARQHK